HAGAMGAETQILDGDAVEAAHDFLLQLEPQGPHDLAPELGAGLLLKRVLAAFERAHHARDLADADAPPFAREAIAAARPAHAGEHASPHELLQHLLEIAPRNA